MKNIEIMQSMFEGEILENEIEEISEEEMLDKCKECRDELAPQEIEAYKNMCHGCVCYMIDEFRF